LEIKIAGRERRGNGRSILYYEWEIRMGARKAIERTGRERGLIKARVDYLRG
jgi:hypothetical protein